MLEEAAQVLIEMWTQDEAHFVGEHYVLGGAITRPKSLQDPHPPLWIAGGGERRTLRIVAEYGDYSNFSGDIEHVPPQVRGCSQRHCDDVGRDYDDIGRSVHLMSVIGRRRRRSGGQTGDRRRTPQLHAR